MEGGGAGRIFLISNHTCTTDMEHWTLVILATDCRNVDDSCKSAVDCLFTPICQVALLDYWSRSFKNSKLVDDVIIVTNQIHHASMLNWAHTRGISNKNILRIANSSQGYFSDLTALLEWSNAHSKQCGFVILTPDIFLPDTFHIDSVLQKLNSNSDCLMFHKASNVEEISPHMSVVDVDHINHISRISTDLSAGISYNENSSVGLILSAASLHKVESYLCENSIPSKLSIHSFINWLISHHNTSFIGHEISDTIYHIASKKDLLAAIEDREKILTHAISHLPQEVTQRCHARVGLMGNPSDGFFGKTISFSLPNFFAHVVITSHQDNTVDIVPHPIYDRHEFRSLDHLLLSTTLHVCCVMLCYSILCCLMLCYVANCIDQIQLLSDFEYLTYSGYVCRAITADCACCTPRATPSLNFVIGMESSFTCNEDSE